MLLGCPLCNSFPSTTKIGKFINALIQADSTINIKAHCICIPPNLKNLYTRKYMGIRKSEIFFCNRLLCIKSWSSKKNCCWPLEGRVLSKWVADMVLGGCIEKATVARDLCCLRILKERFKWPPDECFKTNGGSWEVWISLDRQMQQICAPTSPAIIICFI